MEEDSILGKYFEKYVPARGPAETKGGEIVRAANRIAYRYFNDGDRVGVGYGNETCNAPARYLMSVCDNRVKKAVSSLWGVRLGSEYGDRLLRFKQAVIEYLGEHPEVFDEKNAMDMWNFREAEDRDYEDEDY